MRYESISRRSRGARPADFRDAHHHCEGLDVVRPIERQADHSKMIPTLRKTVCKDAGSQTDLTIRKEDTLSRSLDQAEEESGPFEGRNGGKSQVVGKTVEAIQEPVRQPVHGESRIWPTHPATEAQYLTQPLAEPFHVDLPGHLAGGGGLLGEYGNANVGLDSELRPSYSGHSTEGHQVVLPEPATLTTGPTSRYFEAYESLGEPQHLHVVQEGHAQENLEDFIRRIEGEASVPLHQENDVWAAGVNEHNVHVLASPRVEPFEPYETMGYGEMSNRCWFPSEGDVLSSGVIGNTGFPGSVAFQKSYPEAREDEYLAMPWGRRKML